MTDPYRDPHRACPACNVPLRAFRARLVCDRCEGILAPIEDLVRAIEDITGVPPVFDFHGETAGKRACPECAGSMRTFKLRIHLEGELAKASPVLDRCDVHGIWFDRDELAAVFEVCRAKHPGGGGARPREGASGTGNSGWSGDSRGPFWWKF